MYKTINGWTKAKMKARIRQKNNGTRCITAQQTCRYRHEDNACVAGCFIPDEVYKPEMEGKDILMLMNLYPSSVMKHVPLDEVGMLRLQELHDHYLATDLHEALFAWIDKYVKD